MALKTAPLNFIHICVNIMVMRKSVFCSHAEEKFKILKDHGFLVSRKKVLEALNKPDKVERGFGDRWIAQKVIDENYVLRVVYEKMGRDNLIITFYPGRRSYYES